MPNLLEPETLGRIRARILDLRPDSPREWGKMTVLQALAHMADQLRIPSGEISAKDVSNFVSRHIVKNLVLAGMPAPKGKVATVAELDQRTGGTPPTTFEADKTKLLVLIDWLVSLPADAKLPAHPFFGTMSKRQWARLAYTHLDHHLRQFGG
jgi:hypothetical protein